MERAMGYRAWRARYAACPGRVDPREQWDHSDPRALPTEDGLSWQLAYSVCGDSEVAVRNWLEELMPPEGQLVSTDGPARRHGHVCATRSVILSDAWFMTGPPAEAPPARPDSSVA